MCLAGTNTDHGAGRSLRPAAGRRRDVDHAVGGPPSSGGYYAGGANIPPVQIDNQVSVNYGITADNPTFEQIIRVLNFVAQSGAFSSTSPTDQANVSLAGQMLTNATQALTGITGHAGPAAGPAQYRGERCIRARSISRRTASATSSR